MDSGGGMRALPPGKDERSEGRTRRMNGPKKEREHARRWRNGNTLALEEPYAKDSGPNDPSSATAGRKANQKGPTPPRRSLERLVRRVTAECSTPQEHASHRRGNDGRCRRERLTEADDEPKGEPRRRSEREQTRLPSQSREEERLTDSSSATEAGEKGRGLQAKADRQPPFAGARC